MVLGTLLVNHLSTRVLFSAGTTHSFINPATTKRLAYKLDEMDVQLCVTTPVGLIYYIKSTVRNCQNTIHDKVFPTYLVLLKIQGYDVIFGMDWLAKHKATIAYEQKLVTLVTPEGERLLYRGTNPK